MPRASYLFLPHFFATVFMNGVIWVIQLVHYPLFIRVGRENYVLYQAEHERRIAWIVGPIMLLELGTAMLLVAYPPAGFSRALLVGNLALLAIVWISTAFLQIPQHHRLESGFDPAAHAALVTSNWIRTALWSLRSAILFFLLGHASR